MGTGRVTGVLVLKVHQIKRGWNQIQPGQWRLPCFISNDVFDPKVSYVLTAGIENRIHRASSRSVDFVPAVQLEQPNRSIRLGIEIADQNAVAHLGQTRRDVHE